MVTTKPQRMNIAAAAGDYSAGDLTPDDAAAFRKAAKDDPSLEREVAFWNTLRTGLKPATEPPAGPGPGFGSLRKGDYEWQSTM